MLKLKQKEHGGEKQYILNKIGLIRYYWSNYDVHGQNCL